MITLVIFCTIICSGLPEVEFPCFQKLYNGGCAGENNNDVLGETKWLGAL